MTAALTATANNVDGKADPGDTINYTVQLGNTTAADATGLSFNPALDSHTTFVPGSIKSTPICFDQTGVATNEDVAKAITLTGQDPDGDTISFSIVTPPAHGGFGITTAPNLTYTPAADYNGPDSFVFRVNDGTTSGAGNNGNSNETCTVSITVNAVNDPPTFTVPGNPASVNEDAGAQSVASFITNVNPGPANESAQTVSFVITNNTNPGIFSSAPALNVVGASYPKTATLTYTPAANQNGTATITYHAHDTGGTSPGVDNSADQTFTITVIAVNDPPVVTNKNYSAQANMKITGLTGLLGGITDADTGTGSPTCNPTFSVKNASFSATSPVGGVISNVNLSTGTFDFDPPPGVTGNVTFTYVVSDNGCPGVADSSPVTVTVAVSGPVIWFVNTTLGPAGNGTLSTPFNNLDAVTNAATGKLGLNANQRVFVFSGSTTAAGTTTTLQGNNSQATQALAQVQAQWLIGQGTVASSFDTFFGITPPAGTIARPTLSSNATTANGMRPTIQGTVTMKENTVVQGLNINTSGGATKGLTASGLAGGASTSLLTIRDVNVTSASSSAVDISSSSGTSSVIYTTSDGSASPNILSATTGTALRVVSTTIGASGMNFRSITSNGSGAANGIILDGAGTGGLTITGNGGTCTSAATCTGGTISNKTGADGTGNGIGIYVNNTSNVSITRMKLNDFTNYGIRGTSVTGFTLNNCFIDGVNGDNAGADEGSIIFDGLLGTSSFSSDTIKGGIEDNFRIKNSSGTANNITIDSCTIRDTSTGVTGNDNLNIEANNTAIITAHVTNNTFAATNGDHIQINTINSATMNIVITGNFYSGGGGANALGQGITLSGGNLSPTSTEHVTFNISNNGTALNPLVGNIQGGAINVNEGQGNGVWQGQVSNNFIGNAAVTNSGSAQSSGIRMENHSISGTLTGIISGNTVRQWNNGPGINTQAGDAGDATNNGVLNVTVTSNTTANSGVNAQHGFVANIGAGAGNNQAQNVACVDVRSNTLDPGPPANSGSGVRIRQRELSTIKIPNYTGAQFDTAAVQAFEISKNPGNTAAIATSNLGGGYGNTPGPGNLCAQPTIITMYRPETNQGDYYARTASLLEKKDASLFALLNASSDFASIVESLNRATSTPIAPLASKTLASQAIAGVGASESRELTTATSPVQVTTFDGKDIKVSSASTRRVSRNADAIGLNDKAPLYDARVEKVSYDSARSSSPHVGKGGQRPEARDQKSDIRSNHAKSVRTEVRGQKSEDRSSRAAAHSAFAPMPFSGGTFPINGTGTGFTLPIGKTITIKFSVTLNNPPNLSGVPPTTPQVSSQGTLSGAFVGNPIVTDDPGTIAANDATVTLVDLFDTTTTLGAVPAAGSWNVGQSVTFTATVASNPAGNPTAVTGSVIFKDNGTAISGCNGVALSSAQAQCVTTFGSGAHSVTAVYSGDGNFDPSTSSALSQGTVSASGTSTAVTSSLNPSLVTQNVTFTATVTSTSGFAGPPTGTVTFKDGVNPITCSNAGGQALNGSGVATCQIATLPAGSHSITAVYPGDTNFTTSTGTLTGDPQVVNKSDTVTVLATSANPVAPTVQVTYTATVSSSTSVTGPPTGTVTFKDGVTTIVCEAGSQALTAGVATCKFTYPDTVGSPHDITAVYGGDGTFNGNTSNHVSEVVQACSASVVVTSNADSGANTLRDAIDNGVCAGGTITFDPSVTSITLTTGELTINKNMTITGPGAATLTVNGNNASRVFNVASGKTATISGMTITSGKVLGANGVAGSAGIDAKGGAVINAGTLTLSNVIVSASHATGGDGGSNTGAGAGGVGGRGLGGGIYNGGTLTLTNTTVNGSNSATGGKGGDTDAANANGNGGAGLGGGVFNTGTLTLTNSTISANTTTGGAAGSGGTAGTAGAGSGGGVYHDATASPVTLTITGSTISGNTASSNGGGIFNVGTTDNATLTISNTTISGNGANNDGGGIFNQGVIGITTLTSVTVTGNTTDKDDLGGGAGGGLNLVSGTVLLQNTIVGGNLKGTASPTAHDITGTADASSSYNLIGDAASSGGLTDGANHNIVGNAGVGTIDIATVLNTTLADNGGPTKTHALVTGSPALEKGNAFGLTTDQRGFVRPVDSDAAAPISPFDDSDIGAFEKQIAPNAPGAPNLDAVSDSGANSTDDKTNVATNLSFTIPGVLSGATVQLFRDGTPVASGVASGASIQLTDPGPLTFTASGTTYSYTAKQSFGSDTSVASAALPVLITIVPDAPVLDPSSDSGTPGDGITNDTSPTFNITNVINGATVELLRDGAPIPGGPITGVAAGTTIQLTDPSAPNGTFTYTARQTFNAITSDPSAGTSITITIKPSAPDLDAASDSGPSNTDDYTNDTTPTFTITGVVNGATVDLLRDGDSVTPVATGTAAGTSIQLTDSTGSAGSHTYRARQTVGITVSPESDPLTITIDTTVTPAVPDLKSTSDSGASNSDDKTNANATRDFTISTSEVGSTVELLRGGAPVATQLNSPGGSLTLTDSTVLADGPYLYSTRETDKAGNVATSGTLQVTIDATKPNVGMSSAVGNPTATTPIPVTVTFSEPVSGFTIASIVPGNGTVGNFAGGPTVYTFDLTPTSPGPVSADIAAGVATDVAGNTNTVATQFNRTFDPSALSVTITPVAPDPRNTSVSSIQIVFNKAVTGFDLPDLSLKRNAGAELLPGAATLTSGDNITWTLGNLSGLTATAGTYVLFLNHLGSNIKDAANNPLTSDATESWVTDTTAPDVTINQAATQPDPVTGPTATTVINFTAVFTKPVVAGTFTNSDVTISGTAGATVVNITEIAPNDGTHFNVALEGMTQSGTVIATIPAGRASDSAGNLNTVSTSTDNTVTYFKDDFTALEVNTTVDGDDGVCAPLGTGNGCTLREAINAANADAGAETITFNASVFAIPGPYVISLLTALPDIADDVTIQGPGANVLTVERNSGAVTNFRIFRVAAGTVIISGLTISKGVLASGGQGGGIFNNTGATLTINNCAISGNQVGSSGFGGGIFSTGTLTLNSSTVNDNHVNTSGGGGGGIYDAGPSMNINNSTISGNTTGTDSKGGGILNANPLPLVINSSTITLNTTSTGAASAGGGIYLASANLTLKNTIVGGGNSSPAGPDIFGTAQSDGFNLIQSTSSATINQNPGAGPNITGQDPLLFALADNGGPTKTHAPQCTSPAIDKGKAFGLTTDQRGGVRPFDLADAVYPNAAGGDGSDIGAYETQTGGGCQPTAVPPSPQPSTNEDTQVTITLKGTYSQNFPLTFVITQQPGHAISNLVPTGTTCTFTTFTECTATVSYKSTLNFNGLDSFKFKASAGGLDSDEADVNITIIPVNDPPVANPQSVITDEDTAAAITLTGSDVDSASLR